MCVLGYKMTSRGKRLVEMALANCTPDTSTTNKSLENVLEIEPMCTKVSNNTTGENTTQVQRLEDPGEIWWPIGNDECVASSSNTLPQPEDNIYVLEPDDSELLDLINMTNIPVIDSTSMYEVKDVLVTDPEQIENSCYIPTLSATGQNELALSVTAPSPLVDIAKASTELEEPMQEKGSVTNKPTLCVTASSPLLDIADTVTELEEPIQEQSSATIKPALCITASSQLVDIAETATELEEPMQEPHSATHKPILCVTASSPVVDIADTLPVLEEPSSSENTNNSVTVESLDGADMPSDSESSPRGTSYKRKRGSHKKWKRNVSKRLRMEGKKYMGYRKNQDKIVQDRPRNERNLGGRCESESCKKYGERKCPDISEDERNHIFKQFWSIMSWEQRKVYVANNVKKIVPKRRYTSNEESRRSVTLIYYLTLKDGSKYPVCKKMFLSTLALGERSVREWVDKCSAGMCASDKVSISNRKSDRHTSQSEQLVHLHLFFNSLPKLPSHYARSNTSKLFLEQSIESLTQLYDLYCEKTRQDNGKPVSRTKFSSVFYELNLSLYTLKKDQCNMCAEHEAGNLSEEEWIQHQHRKDRARKEKEDDKQSAAQRQCTVLTMDLQAVKVAPCIQASAFYYKTKLTCHNFTVYNLTTHHCMCYWFSEVDTDLSASTFATLIINYLKCNCANDKEIIIFSDGCTYQNRNSILGNALLDHAINSGQTITQKFLERGHTQMECDSVHSAIERKLKKRPIHLPSNYITVTEQARKKPFPYEAKWMYFDGFTDYSVKSLQR